MNFFKSLNFPLKSSEIPVGLCFQLASVTINFTDNHDYRAVLYSMVAGAQAGFSEAAWATALTSWLSSSMFPGGADAAGGGG
jgi:hypothetical protein